ncbi:MULTISPECIES: plastocyanin/azurin family copper-binding protein [unclassified Methylophaga]|jgi:pseudoazurin|uniref:plastocyanin/azurin family copper-binding protein n=1 Tax=unclassified Methylophaga TaxID=2629249 RepID=UPI000C89D54B|nr:MULTISPECIES: plastocyanin/azurin family copper-binding protein [unclassified Methylophaga]MAK66175.1 copper-binding protein [Methylophaga sp.]MAK68239.1 copper-binding protein [Methylophaga sp.]MAY17371.1 copper-binding protein [Methylophaga sp.]HCD03735.1 copper-binding protein [Methylophaga sp.]|tara:strand:+ start:18609 stop:19301 length:693 start_codon:yes stop_codon:yes gene_type:complete
MFKATSTLTQTKRITLALTMTFAAATLFTACGSDDNSDTIPTPETEMSSENQSNIEAIEETPPSAPEAQVVIENEPAAELDQTDTTVVTEENNLTGTPDDTTAQTDEPKSEGAETHFVTAQGMVFNPLVVKINPGDSVSWRNMSTHNSESIDGLIPEGAEKWNSPMSENYQRTFTEEGIYVYKCTPHIGTGMGGVIIVGDPVNLEQIKNADVTGGAGRLVRKAISEAESM